MNAGSLRVAVVGAGTVGSATGRALADWGNDVVFQDVDDAVLADLSDMGYETAQPGEDVDADLSLVAVPTPFETEAGAMNTDIVANALETLAAGDPGVVAVRSTVPPTTTRRLCERTGIDHYGMVPEFLFEDSAREDLASLETVVVGASDGHARSVIKRAFEPKVATFVEVSPTEAELIKFSSNVFAATKISFSNEMWRLGSHLHSAGDSVDPDTVLAGVRQVSPWFGAEMGMEGGWPYGGHCLPKDTRGLRAWAKGSESVMVPQLSGTIAENELVRSYGQRGTVDATAASSDD